MNLDRLCEDLEDGDWAGFLRDWDRSLRAANHPETTRYNYLLAASQLAKYLADESPDPDADDAAQDPTVVTKAHIESFQAWMIEIRSASTALNKHKGLQMLLAAVGVALTLQLAGIYLPVLQNLLGTQSLALGDLLIVAACSGLGYAAIRLDRLIHPTKHPAH